MSYELLSGCCLVVVGQGQIRQDVNKGGSAFDMAAICSVTGCKEVISGVCCTASVDDASGIIALMVGAS